MIDFGLLQESIPALLQGAMLSVAIAACAVTVGVSLGTLLGLGQALGAFPLKALITVYVTVVRGTPMLIHLFAAFYILPQFGINLSPFWAATIAIGLNSAAYVSQMIRAGVQAVPVGQLEAAQVLGLPMSSKLRNIILPQTYTFAWPSLGNEVVTLIKDSSLASIIGVMELSKQGAIIRSRTYDAFTILLAVAVIYLVMTSVVQLLWNRIEKRSLTHAES